MARGVTRSASQVVETAVLFRAFFSDKRRLQLIRLMALRRLLLSRWIFRRQGTANAKENHWHHVEAKRGVENASRMGKENLLIIRSRTRDNPKTAFRRRILSS
jgi:hypothetical protein